MDIKIGQTVESKDGKHGVVRYSGPLDIAAGHWLGLELPDDTGKNDGSVQGKRYFTCAPGYGIFIRKESVVRIVKQAPVGTRPNGVSTTNGGVMKPRQSAVGVSADAARKRQSMMSTASSTAGSRLSVRSPTKSPTKAMSSTSSATSTPRTSTPATTTRTSDSSAKSRLSTAGRTSMAPPPAPKKAVPPRQSLSGVAARATPTATSTRPTAGRSSLAAGRQSLAPRSPAIPSSPPLRPPHPDEDPGARSPPIEEDEEAGDEPVAQTIDQVLRSPPADNTPAEQPEPAPSERTTHSRTPSISRTNLNAEARAADKKEMEQVKAKLRTMEKKIADDREKLHKFDALQADKDRYETIIQTLQKKMKANQQTLSELRAQKEEAERKAKDVPLPSGELESELELANLDREMAEERADLAQAELEELRAKHEEAELELDILREENRELSATMSPEELSSAGWLQKEREIERLRQAVGLLRDHSKETEEELQAQLKELRDTLDETEKTASLYQETAAQLAHFQSTNKHLMEQLEDAETNDEVVVALETQREQSAAMIEQLKQQIQEFEEHIQVTDELEKFHVEEERQLHNDLDDAEAHLNEKDRQVGEQEKVIEDLEFHLSRFREVVSDLQHDIEQLRQSRDFNETEAQEMSVKSRAMADLNLQLQNSAAKTQLKTIDYEMRDMQAEQAKSHLDIVQLFVPETFDQDRNPVLAMLAFKRIKSKAALVRTLLGERMRDRPHLAQDDPFSVFEVMEKMDRINCCCERFLQFIQTCSAQQFHQMGGALYEIEPVERAMNVWVEALRRDELGAEGPEYIQRMIGILLDMAEKLIPESNECKSMELIAQSSMTDRYTDIVALELTALVRIVQQRLGEAKEDDEEALAFHKRIEGMATKSRTIKYLSGKITQALVELRATSMCLGETSWVFFEDALQSAEQISHLIRTIGRAAVSELSKVDHEETLSYATIANLMLEAAQTLPNMSSHDSIYALLISQLSSLAGKVDDLSTRSADLSSAVEFEASSTPPWAVRAKQLKQQKVISQDTAEELARLKQRSDSQLRDLAEKNKEAEELRIRVELLESRQKEAKARDGEVTTLKSEVERITAERVALEQQIETTQGELQSVKSRQAKEREELDALKAASALTEGGTAGAAAAQLAGMDMEGNGGAWRAEADMLKTEVLSLQAAVRFLRAENYNLRVPVGEVALRAERNAWLVNHPRDSLVGGGGSGKHEQRKKVVPSSQRDAKHVLDDLIDLAGSMKSVRLKARQPDQLHGRSTAAWRSNMRDSSQLLVAQQREVLERWMADVADVKRRARLEGNATRSGDARRRVVDASVYSKYALPPLPGEDAVKGGGGGVGKEVRIADVDG